MKKFLIMTIIAASSLSLSSGVSADPAGSCHFHGSKPAEPDTVSRCAWERKEILIEKAKIDSSWDSIQQDRLEQVEGKKGKEWLVTFRNPNARDKAQETLYMFFTLTGNFIAANFTGK